MNVGPQRLVEDRGGSASPGVRAARRARSSASGAVLPFLLVAASLASGGCAAAPPGERVVLLESDAYGCAAEEGLGCGLALAPVLQEIDGLDGVARSGVSWDGRTFRIEVLPGADPDRVAEAAASLMEGGACCVSAPAGRAPAAEPGAWYDAEGTIALSRHEADVLASSFASGIVPEAGLGTDDADRLRAVLREELERAFERAHADGGGVFRLWEQLPRSRAEFERRLGFLSADERARVSAYLDRRLAE